MTVGYTSLGLFLLARGISAQDPRMAADLRTELKNSVEVRLSTDKTVYDLGEHVQLNLEVRNRGQRAFYIYPRARLGYDGDGVFRVYVLPHEQCQMRARGEASDFFSKDQSASLSAYIEKSWRLLGSGQSIVLNRTLETSPCVGENILRVNYFTKLQAWSPAQIQAAEVELKYPVAYGSYDGNSVVITVRSRQADR